MAAGNVVVAHNSGGPKLDIVTPLNNEPTGFLAATETEYADAMATIFDMTSAQRCRIRENARESVQRFCEREFELAFLNRMSLFFDKMYGQGDGSR
jgi:alpha-1,2-mannosyltransferase